MGSIDHLRKQHGELIRLAKEIAPLLDAERLALGFMKARLKLGAFARKVSVHLALEERFVYGRLVHHPSPVVVSKATELQNQSKALRESVTQYVERWITPAADAEPVPAEFVEETTRLFDLVSKACNREDREIYPLVDQLIIDSGTWPLDAEAEADEGRKVG